MIDKHGLKMHGLKSASAETKWLHPYGPIVQISYNTRTGAILTDVHASINSWSEYTSGDVVTICYTDRPMTMQGIADFIRMVMDFRAEKRCRAAW